MTAEQTGEQPNGTHRNVPLRCWGAWVRRKAQCRSCKEAINAGEMVIKGVSWYNGKRWLKLWHLQRADGRQCWLEDTKAWLRDHPFVPQHGGPGRPALELTHEEWLIRRALLTKAYRLRREKLEAAKQGWDWKYPRIEADMLEVARKLLPVGGPPKHWHINLQTS